MPWQACCDPACMRLTCYEMMTTYNNIFSIYHEEQKLNTMIATIPNWTMLKDALSVYCYRIDRRAISNTRNVEKQTANCQAIHTLLQRVSGPSEKWLEKSKALAAASILTRPPSKIITLNPTTILQAFDGVPKSLTDLVFGNFGMLAPADQVVLLLVTCDSHAPKSISVG